MNEIIIIGNAVRDPEIYEGNTADITKVDVAVNRANDEVDFFAVKAFGKVGDVIGEYVKKGNKVAVIGSMQSRKYEKDGEQRTVWEVIAKSVELLTPKPQETEQPKNGNRTNRNRK